MVPSSLGETVTVCGFAKSFLEKYGYGITLVISESHAFIAECFPNTFDRIVYLSMENMRQFSSSGYIPQNFFNIDFPINTWSDQNGDGRTLALHKLWIESVGKSGLHFLDMYRYILRLDWGAKFTAPKAPEHSYVNADVLIKEHNIKPKKSVVFFIGNNSNKPSPAYLWVQLAKLYSENGYEVLINKHGAMFTPDNLYIPNAKIIDIPLDVAIPICEHAGNVVSGSNGFILLALAAKSDCKINVLLPNEICYDYSNFLFKEVNYLTGCCHLATPELTFGANQFKEWIIPKNNNEIILDEIAKGIVFNINNEHTIAN